MKTEQKTAELTTATTVEPGRRYSRPTGARHVFRLPADWMTISFSVTSGKHVNPNFPRFVLRSTDGSYENALVVKSNLLPGRRYLELRFERLVPGKLYTLTHVLAEGVRHVVFEGRAFFDVVDQPRAHHERLVRHAYAELGLDDVERA